MLDKDNIIIFTDGASKGNPGPGGWGAVIVLPDEVIEIGGSNKKTTNNEMELIALCRALEYLDGYEPKIKVYLDSKYVLSGMTRWLLKWKENSWKTTSKKSVTHKGLWMRLDAALDKYDPEIIHIPGHSGIPGNERADKIASAYAEGLRPILYSGSIESYGIDFENISPSGKTNIHKKKRSRAKAYSYVSCVNGLIKIHKIWDECEKLVNGAKGAHFKKALSKKEEKEIINEYQKYCR